MINIFFLQKDPKGELVILKDGTKVTLIYELKEIKKINPKQIMLWQNSLVTEYVHNNQKIPWNLKEAKQKLNDMQKQIKDKNAIAIYVFDNKQMIGNISINRNKGKQDHFAGLGISIAKDYRNKGLGQILINKAIELAKKELKDINFIQLGCYKNNSLGIGLYKKCGFKEVAKLPKVLQWKPPGQNKMQYKDEIIMHYNLKSKDC